jgi:hypothetical protein
LYLFNVNQSEEFNVDEREYNQRIQAET